MGCILMPAGLDVTTHETQALTTGLCIFPSRPDNADHVKIYLDRQLILASMVRGECYLRVWCPLDGKHAQHRCVTMFVQRVWNSRADGLLRVWDCGETKV